MLELLSGLFGILLGGGSAMTVLSTPYPRDTDRGLTWPYAPYRPLPRDDDQLCRLKREARLRGEHFVH